MDLTILVFAINVERSLGDTLRKLQAVSRDIVVGVDDSTTDRTFEVARQYTTQVYSIPHSCFLAAGQPGHVNALEYMLGYCRGDWVLRIDQDETLSDRWADPPYISRLLSHPEVTHCWIARRWVLPPGDRFIASGHWCPDYQLRMVRNVPSLIDFNHVAHVPISVAGEARFITDAFILHWHLCWFDRSRRESRVRFWRELGVFDGSPYYLYEDYGFETLPISSVYPPVWEPRGATCEAKFNARLAALQPIRQMWAGEVRWIPFGIQNLSDRTLVPHREGADSPGVRLAYHWFGPAPAITDTHTWGGARTELPYRLAPGEHAEGFLVVNAPETSGEYLFQLDAVQEGIGWLSGSAEVPKYPVKVV